jgi:hypothetical protein
MSKKRKWEWGHGNSREWETGSHSCSSQAAATGGCGRGNDVQVAQQKLLQQRWPVPAFNCIVLPSS